MESSESEFTGWRKTLFPIHKSELWKLVPMFLMSFFTCFNQSLLRNLKDTLVISAEGSGAEVIPFIKLWGILPGAILATSLFTWLSNRYSRPKVFNILLIGFLLFFFLFAFVFFPARELVHPHAFCDWLEGVLPTGFNGFVAMFRNWTLSFFYIVAEMWGTVVLGILFWGFANEITKVSEARRFYGVLGMGSNLAAIVAGKTGMVLSFATMKPFLPYGSDKWEQSLMSLTLVIVVVGMVTLGLYQWMIKRVLIDEPSIEVAKPKKKKQKMGFLESIRFVSGNSYLRNIAVIVVSYSLVINLVEIIWKSKLKLLFPEATDLNHFMMMVTMVVGIISASTALFMAAIIRRLGWTQTALIAPLILLVTGLGFFGSMYLPGNILESALVLTGAASPLALVAFFGAAQNCLSKAAKYSVYDTTKEIAFIPLDSMLKLRGKAAIDGIGSRLGKSGSSAIQQVLLLFFGGSILAITPIVAGILVFVVAAWFFSVISVGKQFNEMTAETIVAKDESLSTQEELASAVESA